MRPARMLGVDKSSGQRLSVASRGHVCIDFSRSSACSGSNRRSGLHSLSTPCKLRANREINVPQLLPAMARTSRSVSVSPS
jgi:hypothetical protein